MFFIQMAAFSKTALFGDLLCQSPVFGRGFVVFGDAPNMLFVSGVLARSVRRARGKKQAAVL